MRASIIRFKAFLEKHERILSGGALLFGFTVDSLTLRRIDLLAENLILIGYLLLAAISIVVLAHREREHAQHRVLAWGVAVAPLALQIAFGALFSAFVIFYFRSASLSASWPFILFLVFMLVGNEKFRPRYEKLVFHVSVYFVALLSYSILLVPIVVRSIGALEFLGSILLAITLILLFLIILRRIAPREVGSASPMLVRSIGTISAVCLVAYLTGLMPPAPLSLSDSAVAHSVVRTGETYALTVEPRTFVDELTLSEEFHRAGGEGAFVWTSVFAPAKLSTSIVHVWQYREGRQWVTKSRIEFPITGGREEGFRGYSIKRSLEEGAWRVSVETREGLVIGRVRFDVIATQIPARQVTVIR
ncbi:MAG: hypothetical protein AMXMBFR44_0350 [Candidatus Campbellbacteria bacterium]